MINLRSAIVAIVAIVLCVILMLTGCSKTSYSATDMLYMAMSVCEDVPEYTVYASISGSELDSESMNALYNDADPSELCEQYAVVLGKSDEVFEIHIYLASSSYRSPEVEKILRRRVDMMQNREIYSYDNENYEDVIAKAEIVSHGRWVCLLVSDDNEAIKKEIF